MLPFISMSIFFLYNQMKVKKTQQTNPANQATKQGKTHIYIYLKHSLHYHEDYNKLSKEREHYYHSNIFVKTKSVRPYVLTKNHIPCWNKIKLKICKICKSTLRALRFLVMKYCKQLHISKRFAVEMHANNIKTTKRLKIFSPVVSVIAVSLLA